MNIKKILNDFEKKFLPKDSVPEPFKSSSRKMVQILKKQFEKHLIEQQNEFKKVVHQVRNKWCIPGSVYHVDVDKALCEILKKL